MTENTRYAVVHGDRRSIEALLPRGYRLVVHAEDGTALIAGTDIAGWTLDDYVLPRLASGLVFGEEIPTPPSWVLALIDEVLSWDDDRDHVA